jgi:hypothetical protein
MRMISAGSIITLNSVNFFIFCRHFGSPYSGSPNRNNDDDVGWVLRAPVGLFRDF